MGVNQPILVVDGAGAGLAMALVQDQQLLQSYWQPANHAQAADFFPTLEQLLRQAGCSLPQLGALVVARGPGSFTGIRVAMAAMQGLALALNKPCYGVDRFAAYAAQLRADGISGAYLMLLDSRRRELFWQHRGADNQLIASGQDEPDHLPTLPCYCDVALPLFPAAMVVPPPFVAFAALAASQDADAMAAALTPLYLRDADVSRPRA